MNLGCLIGFTFSYIVYVKKAVPGILILYVSKEKLGWLVKDYDSDSVTPGGVFFGMLFSFGVLFPMSIPRNASVLRFSSLFGVLCSG